MSDAYMTDDILTRLNLIIEGGGHGASLDLLVSARQAVIDLTAKLASREALLEEHREDVERLTAKLARAAEVERNLTLSVSLWANRTETAERTVIDLTARVDFQHEEIQRAERRVDEWHRLHRSMTETCGVAITRAEAAERDQDNWRDQCAAVTATMVEIQEERDEARLALRSEVDRIAALRGDSLADVTRQLAEARDALTVIDEAALAAVDEMREERDEACTKLDDLGWQPIETARQNANDVLVLYLAGAIHDRPGRPVAITAHYACGDGDGMQPAFGPGWFYWSGYDFCELKPHPTHWMPLPALPAKEPEK